MVTTEADVPVAAITATDPVADVPVEGVPDVPADLPVPVPDLPVPDLPVPDLPVPLPLPELPAAGMLDGLLATIGDLLSSLLGGLPVPLPVPGV